MKNYPVTQSLDYRGQIFWNFYRCDFLPDESEVREYLKRNSAYSKAKFSMGPLGWQASFFFDQYQFLIGADQDMPATTFSVGDETCPDETVTKLMGSLLPLIADTATAQLDELDLKFAGTKR